MLLYFNQKNANPVSLRRWSITTKKLYEKEIDWKS
jgi:hypothetical protein